MCLRHAAVVEVDAGAEDKAVVAAAPFEEVVATDVDVEVEVAAFFVEVDGDVAFFVELEVDVAFSVVELEEDEPLLDEAPSQTAGPGSLKEDTLSE